MAFLETFSLRSWEFGSLLFDHTNLTSLFPPEPASPPDQEALHFLTQSIPTVDMLIEKAISVRASQLGSDPWIKKYLERTTKVYLNTSPTEQGRREIDAFHEYYPFKYITRKPVEDFLSGNSDELEQYLLIAKAEKAKLISVSFSCDEDYENQLNQNFIYPDPSSPWNGLRERILKRGVEVYLNQWVIESARNTLMDRAFLWLESTCRCLLQEKLMVSPITLSPSIQSPPEADNWRVMAISFGKGDIKSQIHVSIVDNLCRTVHQESWSARADFTLSLTALLDQFSPIAIGVGGQTIATRRLYEGIKLIAMNVPVFYVPDDSARIELALDPSSSLFSYTSSLARKMIFPLYEYAKIYATAPSSFISLPLHPLQQFLPPGRLQGCIERAFVNVVNLVGVDFNLSTCSRHFSAFHVLPFVCGLGTRKAHFLRDQVTQGNAIFVEKRSELSAIVGKCVFTNCASFLRLDPNYFPARTSTSISSKSNEPLDITRIHPESYYIARKMAANALDVEESPDDDTFNQSVLVEEVMENSHKLNELDLDGFAKELERIHSVLKHLTLQDIKAELQAPFRVSSFIPFVGASEDELFEMLTGETCSTLYPGLIVSGSVGKVIEGRTVFVRLDSGVTGILPFRNIPQDATLRSNEPIVCRVLSLSKERFAVDVTARPADLKIIPSKYSLPPDSLTDESGQALWNAISPSIHTPDRYFDVERERKDLDLVTQLNKKHEQTINASRLISHSSYRPWTRAQAEKWLDEHGSAGDFLFRPSSQGIEHLTLTLKILPAHSRFVHFDIRESGKARSNALGTTLSIGGENYATLDEIINRLVHPLMDYVSELAYHPRFLPTPTPTSLSDAPCASDQLLDAYVTEHLCSARAEDPSKIPYCLWECVERPGRFWFGWVPGTKSLRKESILVFARGFKFKGEAFENLADLINWFKRHCNKM